MGKVYKLNVQGGWVESLQRIGRTGILLTPYDVTNEGRSCILRAVDPGMQQHWLKAYADNSYGTANTVTTNSWIFHDNNLIEVGTLEEVEANGTA
jgi:hypothetical protein